MPGAIIVMAKEPRAGFSKTRLCPPLTPEEAAVVAMAALLDTFDSVAACSATRRVLALDGERGPWVPDGFDVIAQRGAGLDERLAAAFADVGGPALIIAMDTPQVTSAMLDDALGALDGADAVLGPSTDGGYWVIGLDDPFQDVVRGVPMSRSDTFDEQRRRICHAGLSMALVRELVDVDSIEDARVVAASIPGSRFASALAAAKAFQKQA